MERRCVRALVHESIRDGEGLGQLRAGLFLKIMNLRQQPLKNPFGLRTRFPKVFVTARWVLNGAVWESTSDLEHCGPPVFPHPRSGLWSFTSCRKSTTSANALELLDGEDVERNPDVMCQQGSLCAHVQLRRLVTSVLRTSTPTTAPHCPHPQRWLRVKAGQGFSESWQVPDLQGGGSHGWLGQVTFSPL